MKIVVREEGTPTTIAVVGRLDATTSPQLEKFATDLYDRGINELVVDLADCSFVSSAGLRVIVAMQKRAVVSGSLTFCNVQPGVMDVFTMTGFTNILTIK